LHADKQLLLDVDNVSVHINDEHILDDISFCLHSGEFVGLIGPNGAGKTTLLRVVLDLLKPTTGAVDRYDTTIGYVPQRGNQYNAIVPISSLEIVKLGAGGSKERAKEALREVGMERYAHKRFNTLSGGQQQRVIIAKAVAGNADILFLDEPTTGIDEHSQAEFYALLRGLQEKGITIVMVSHDVDAVLTLVTRVICLNQIVLYDGSPEHFETDKYMPDYYKARHRHLHHNHELHVHGDTHA
jgi:zinc transport system ATP-binding protein